MTKSDPMALTDDLRRQAQERGWSQDLIDRAERIRVSPSVFRDMLRWTRDVTKSVGRALDRIEEQTFGALRVREATSSDNEKYAELFLNSPEQIGDWEATVDRSPYAFAQFRLQERPQIQFVEDRGVILSSIARSTRRTLVGGVPLNVLFTSAARTHRDARGRGLSWYVRSQDPATVPYSYASYFYFRSQNFSALAWLRADDPDRLSDAPEREGDLPGIPVTVHHFDARAGEGSVERIRRSRVEDSAACVDLINRTHEGLDLFRPYSIEFFHQRLDDGGWGPKPAWWTPVYGWSDYWVLEEEGRIVACAGLWDRGRHLREHWRNLVTGEERTLDCAALLDFGFAQGREDAMAHLVEHCLHEAHRLGRGRLLAPFDQLPALLERLDHLQPLAETWSMQWEFGAPKGSGLPDLRIARPYTDLVYW
jgi:hypothetical protein